MSHFSSVVSSDRFAAIYWAAAIDRKFGGANGTDDEIVRILTRLDWRMIPDSDAPPIVGGNRVLGQSTWCRALRRLGRAAEAERRWVTLIRSLALYHSKLIDNDVQRE